MLASLLSQREFTLEKAHYGGDDTVGVCVTPATDEDMDRLEQLFILLGLSFSRPAGPVRDLRFDSPALAAKFRTQFKQLIARNNSNQNEALEYTNSHHDCILMFELAGVDLGFRPPCTQGAFAKTEITSDVQCRNLIGNLEALSKGQHFAVSFCTTCNNPEFFFKSVDECSGFVEFFTRLHSEAKSHRDDTILWSNP